MVITNTFDNPHKGDKTLFCATLVMMYVLLGEAGILIMHIIACGFTYPSDVILLISIPLWIGVLSKCWREDISNTKTIQLVGLLFAISIPLYFFYGFGSTSVKVTDVMKASIESIFMLRDVAIYTLLILPVVGYRLILREVSRN